MLEVNENIRNRKDNSKEKSMTGNTFCILEHHILIKFTCGILELI